MFGKLAEAQKKAEEIKARLSAITVEGTSGKGNVKAIVDGNKKIKDILISDELLYPSNRTELQQLIVAAMEDALEKAENISNAEMRSLVSNVLPGFGNMFGSK